MDIITALCLLPCEIDYLTGRKFEEVCAIRREWIALRRAEVAAETSDPTIPPAMRRALGWAAPETAHAVVRYDGNCHWTLVASGVSEGKAAWIAAEQPAPPHGQPRRVYVIEARGATRLVDRLNTARVTQLLP